MDLLSSAAPLQSGARLLIHALSDVLGEGTWRVMFAVGSGSMSHLAPCLLEIGTSERKLISHSGHDPIEVIALALGSQGIVTAQRRSGGCRMVWSVAAGQVRAMSAKAAAGLYAHDVELQDAPAIQWF